MIIFAPNLEPNLLNKKGTATSTLSTMIKEVLKLAKIDNENKVPRINGAPKSANHNVAESVTEVN